MSLALRRRYVCTWLMASFLAVTAGADEIPFTPDRWDLSSGRVVDYLGRKAMMGTAALKDATFTDGVIEVDLAVTGRRSYPGMLFRVRDEGNYERIYIRPHRSGCVAPSLYTDVLQYLPAFNGADSWQLYSGPGLTAGAVIPLNQWFRLRIEVAGTQARVFIGDAATPDLLIPHLVRGASTGGIVLQGPPDGSAYFSNFSFRADPGLRFDPPPFRDTVPGILREWEISQPFRLADVDLRKTPAEQGLERLEWKKLRAVESGLVDIALLYPRSGQPDCVFARTTVEAAAPRLLDLDLGYSDVVSVFANGVMFFSGASVYGGRDPSFLGVAGYFDTVVVPLRKGTNEILIALGEYGGGWGFMARDSQAVFTAEELTSSWETGKVLPIPESAAYDPASGAIFVSGYDAYNRSGPEGRQFISRLTLDGRVDKTDWVGGLHNPTGLAVRQSRLWATEPTSVVEIDIAAGKILARHEVAGAVMLNDIALGEDGATYVSDFRGNAIYRIAEGRVERYLEGGQVGRPNGVLVQDGSLFWVNVMDSTLKVAEIATKQIRVVARFGPGLLDGLALDGKGNLLVSHNEGRIFRVTPSGEVSKLLDTSGIGLPAGDFTFIPDKRLLVVPTFTSNTVRAWRME